MNLNDASLQYRFLDGPGTLGQHILAHDWANTALGPLSDWPQSLKTVVSLMINSRQPMWLGWGEQAIFLYNDAYIEVLTQSKHPWALGRPAAEVWAEIWDICGPMAARVFSHGEATLADDMRLFMNREHGLEENYYSFSYSPIRDESGEVGGLFCTNAEMTAKHLNTRRLHTLSQLASGALMEKTVAAACATAANIIAGNGDDIPFALLYLSDGDRHQARLEQSIQLSSGHTVAPALIDLDNTASEPGSAWPVARVLAEAKPVLITLMAQLAAADLAALPTGLAQQAVKQALLLPLIAPGQDYPLGVLICGINPTRPLDHDYHSFFSLLAAQVNAAILNARAVEADKRRADLLLELDQAKTTFFSNVSHEFRTPLTLMLGPLEEMLADTNQPLLPMQRQRADMMQRNAMRLQRLVNALLDFSRAQAGNIQAAYQRVDLASLTADLASTFRSTIEAAGLQFEVDCPPLQEDVFVDVEMWEKIVLNLLSNAYKFTFEGKISLVLAGHGEQVSLTVSDTGVGIAADQLPLVFKRFHRIEGSQARTHEGSGIGLALVHDLVTLHGGQIHIDSTVDIGSSFTLTLPSGRAHLPTKQVGTAALLPPIGNSVPINTYAAEAERWLLSRPEERQPGVPSVATSKGARILIADDNADIRDYLTHLLKPRWHVSAVGDGQTALAAARHELPDLIVSDVMMPQLDGFGLLAQLRAEEATRHIPMLMLSARSGEEARLEGLAAGADDYMVKPFSSRELVVRIESLLLRAQIRALEKRHADRMTTIFAQAPVAIAITRGPLHVFELANPLYRELIGNRPIIGRSVRESLPELEGQEILELLDDVYRRAEPYTGRSLGINLRRGNQSPLEKRFFDFVYQPMFTPDGSIEGIAMVAFEVTELTRARQAAEIANRTKDEFLAMLGHELRNPLTPILTAVHLMRLRGSGAEKECSVIERQARHLVRLVDDLLDVSRVTQGKVNLQKKKLNVTDIISKAIETVSPLLEERQHHLSLNVPSQGLLIHADPERLTQVLANLLTNACKYTENRGEIQIDAYLDNNHVVIDVRDNGIGIKANMLPHVFDMFAQESQALDRAGGGLGLGLAIVRSLTELHGGSVHVFSEGAGRGTVFTLKLSAILGDYDTISPPLRVDDSSKPATQALTCNVLVVDDNQDAAQILAELLSMQGHQVQIAFDGPSALEMVSHFTPQIALLDIGLPIMDGYDVAEHMRSMPHLQGISLIALTGYGQASDKLRSAQAGFDHHLVKPVDIDVVDELIRSTMAASSKVQASAD